MPPTYTAHPVSGALAGLCIVLSCFVAGCGRASQAKVEQGEAKDQHAPLPTTAPDQTVTNLTEVVKLPLDSFVNSVGIRMLRLHARIYMMGSPDSDPDADADEKGPNRRQVVIAEAWMGQTEVTRAQWARVMGSASDPSYWKDDPSLPVNNVSWVQAQRFCMRLSVIENRHYRLPTEMEWECACRAGIDKPRPLADPADEKRDPHSYMNVSGSQRWLQSHGQASASQDIHPASDLLPPDQALLDRPMPVASFAPNPWGFYDMLGNVYEWTGTRGEPDNPDDLDNTTWKRKLTPFNATTNSQPRLFFIVRGGSFAVPAEAARSANRYGQPAVLPYVKSDLGFRIALNR